MLIIEKNARVEDLNELKDLPKCEHHNNKYPLLSEVSSPIDLTLQTPVDYSIVRLFQMILQ